MHMCMHETARLHEYVCTCTLYMQMCMHMDTCCNSAVHVRTCSCAHINMDIQLVCVMHDEVNVHVTHWFRSAVYSIFSSQCVHVYFRQLFGKRWPLFPVQHTYINHIMHLYYYTSNISHCQFIWERMREVCYICPSLILYVELGYRSRGMVCLIICGAFTFAW